MQNTFSGTIMAIGAHHDDNEGSGGTLVLHSRAGWRVISVVMTDGMWTPHGVSPDNVPIRESESAAAAEILGTEPVFLRFPEGEFRATDEVRLALVRVIRKYRPAILVTHPPEDYHLHHTATSASVTQAVQEVWNPLILPEVESCQPPVVYYADAWFVPFQADEYIDISEVIDLKLDAQRCHKSQIPSQSDETNSIIELSRVRSRHRGIEACVAHAEAFRMAPLLGRVRLSSLLRP